MIDREEFLIESFENGVLTVVVMGKRYEIKDAVFEGMIRCEYNAETDSLAVDTRTMIQVSKLPEEVKLYLDDIEIQLNADSV